MKTCATCQAFSPTTNECRRHAPTAIVVDTPKGVAVKGIYPATVLTGGCFEHVASDEQEPEK